MSGFQASGAGAIVAEFPASGAETAYQPDTSVFGVLLLSAFAVTMAIAAAALLGCIAVAAWWLITHIPIPAGLHHLFILLHLTH